MPTGIGQGDTAANADSPSLLQRMMENHALTQVDDQPADIESNQESQPLADENNYVFQQPENHALTQVEYDDQQAVIEGNQGSRPLADEYNMYQQPVNHALTQVDDQQAVIESNPESQPLAYESNMFMNHALTQEDDQPADIESNQESEDLAYESNTFQQPMNQALTQVESDDGQPDTLSDESDQQLERLADSETNNIQQWSLEDLEEAMKDAFLPKQTDSNTAIADDIVALLQGEDITRINGEREEQGMSQSIDSSFSSGLQMFVNMMNRMISRYSNVLSCFPKMQAEMQWSDDVDEEMVKEVVDRLATIQGQQNRQLRQLFRRIQKFIGTTSSEGKALYRKIQRTLGRFLRGYKVVISCVKRRQG